MGEECDEVQLTVLVPPADVFLRDVMASSSDPGLHALDMQLRAGKAHVPEMNCDPLCVSLCEKVRNCTSIEGGLECEIEALVDRSL